ncbi:unnamed protein product [Ixodes pacificus]
MSKSVLSSLNNSRDFHSSFRLTRPLSPIFIKNFALPQNRTIHWSIMRVDSVEFSGVPSKFPMTKSSVVRISSLMCSISAGSIGRPRKKTSLIVEVELRKVHRCVLRMFLSTRFFAKELTAIK